MLSLEVTVTYLDGRQVESGKSTVRDEVQFERRFDLGLAVLARPEPKMEWIYFIAWQMLHRTGKETSDYEAFLDLIQGIDLKVDPKASGAVPTQPARPAAG